MVRPLIDRKVAYIPEVKKFIPVSEANGDELEGNMLLLEEIEAIRLKDYEGLDQQECADMMNVSRPTFRRILLSAHEKISDSLLNGKSITIDDKIENIHIVDDNTSIGSKNFKGKQGCGHRRRGKHICDNNQESKKILNK